MLRFHFGFVTYVAVVHWLDDWSIVGQIKRVNLSQRAVCAVWKGMAVLCVKCIKWSQLAYCAAFTENHIITFNQISNCCLSYLSENVIVLTFFCRLSTTQSRIRSCNGHCKSLHVDIVHCKVICPPFFSLLSVLAVSISNLNTCSTHRHTHCPEGQETITNID